MISVYVCITNPSKAFVCCLGLLLLGVKTFQEEEWSSSNEVTSLLCALGIANGFRDLSSLSSWKQWAGLVPLPRSSGGKWPCPLLPLNVPNTAVGWKTVRVVGLVLLLKPLTASWATLLQKLLMTQLTIGKAQRAVHCTYCNKMKYKPQTTNHAHDLEAGEYFSARFPDSHKGGRSDQVTSSSMLSQESSGLQAESRVDFSPPHPPTLKLEEYLAAFCH